MNEHDPITFAFSSTLLHFVTPNGGEGEGERPNKEEQSDSI